LHKNKRKRLRRNGEIREGENIGFFKNIFKDFFSISPHLSLSPLYFLLHVF